ncbi:MAG: PGPGW domain-containing protein [Pseudomonadota bacterium]
MQELVQQFQWLTPYMVWLGWASAGLFLLSLVLVPVLLARIPTDYFSRTPQPRIASTKIERIHYSSIWVLRNVIAAVLVLAGVIMLVLPGQGLLTIFLGLVTADFPGKKRLELRLVSHPPIYASINWIRKKKGADRLLLP